MGTDGDILVTHSPPVFGHTAATSLYNSYGNCRFQNQNSNVQRQRLKSPNRATGSYSRSASTGSLERKPNRPCLVVRPDDSSSGSSSSGSSDENESPSPTRQKKKVVFADQRGFSLTQIRLMVEPLETLSVPVVKALSHLKVDSASGNGNSSSSGGGGGGGGCENTTQKPISNNWKVTFSQPASNYLDFRKRLEEGNVSLENVILKNNENELTGTVKVKNICFEKAVYIRCTTSDWTDYTDTACVFVNNNTSSSVTIIYDTFSFKISLPETDKSTLQFCVRFASTHGEFWDNNNAKNYTIVRNAESVKEEEQNMSFVRSAITSNDRAFRGPVRANTWPRYTHWSAENAEFQASSYW